MYPDIKRAGTEARALLLQQSPPRLPVRVRQMRFPAHSIIIDSLSNFCRITHATMAELCAGTDCLRDGCTLILPGKQGVRYVVLYNEDAVSHRRINFTLAHELGHIFLGHKEDGEIEEREANHFAAELVIPRILAAALLKDLPAKRDPTQALAAFFGVSSQAAKIRRETLFPSLPFCEQEEKLLKRYSPLLRNSQPIVTY